MRLVSFIAIATVCAACQRPVEVRGLYVNDHGPGNFLPCDRPKAIVLVNDSTLLARYHLTATRSHPPTKQEQEVFQELSGRLDKELAQLGGLETTELAAFKRMLRDLNVPAVGGAAGGDTR